MLNAVLRSHWSIFGKNESCGQSCGSFTEVTAVLIYTFRTHISNCTVWRGLLCLYISESGSNRIKIWFCFQSGLKNGYFSRAISTTSGPISRCILNMFLNILIYEYVMSLRWSRKLWRVYNVKIQECKSNTTFWIEQRLVKSNKLFENAPSKHSTLRFQFVKELVESNRQS